MQKKAQSWRVEDLEKRHSIINFPEYQREPNVWERVAKQRLIDSMLRQFDIASFYLYRQKDGSLDCIDGRQRIGAIMSFLGRNEDDPDNGFGLKQLNEIYDDAINPRRDYEGLSFSEIRTLGAKEPRAKELIEQFYDYQLTIVLLTGSERPEEFNLQFTRLNLGTIINSGEKLHAMVGAMRDACFDEKTGLGQHRFLSSVSIPTRRYSKEQVAAQVVAQVFAFRQTGAYSRTRHYDLQLFFKDNAKLNSEQKGWLAEIWAVFDLLADTFEDLSVFSNRAITVSAVLLAWKLGIATKKKATLFAAFINEFVCRLRWQVGKGLDVDLEYRYLIDFQRHVTQASVEKPAVEARETTLKAEYESWGSSKALSGDKSYARRTKRNPDVECRR